MHLLVNDPELLHRARAIVDGELDAVELAASRFRPDSEVCRLARSNGDRQPVSSVLAGLITAALGAARTTDGDVDPTVGRAVVELGYGANGFGSSSADQLDLQQVSTRTKPIDWTAVNFDGRSVQLPPGVLLDLGATAKAVAADRCASRIYQEVGAGVLVNLGGDISTAGPAPMGGWRILVQDTDEAPAGLVTIGTDTGLATSSTCRRRWSEGGRQHHHIVDPRTGRSAEPVWQSVSVTAQTCLAANTVSTAAIVRGLRAPAWIESLGVPARLVDASGCELTLGGWPS